MATTDSGQFAGASAGGVVAADEVSDDGVVEHVQAWQAGQSAWREMLLLGQAACFPRFLCCFGKT